MTTKRYATSEQSIEKANSSLDTNAMFLCGAFVKDISLNIGWGNSGSTCDIVLIPEYDIRTKLTTYKQPHIGSVLRVAIPNSNPISISDSLFDQNNPYSRLSFTGIVTSVDFNNDSSGKTVSVRLTDGKEILNNIPVVMRKQDGYNLEKLGIVSNAVYAFPEDGKIVDEEGIPYVNEKGMLIQIIRDAVQTKTFTYFEDNKSGNAKMSDLHRYTIDMSRMFNKRIGEPFEYSSNFAKWDEDDPFNQFDSGGFDETFVYEENDYVCSPNFRIDGEFKSLGDIINQAMEQNGCDWFVYCDEIGDNHLTGKVSNTIVIRIIPVPRNDFDQLTKGEMDKFASQFGNEMISSSFGNELQNSTSNRGFYGPKIEKLEKTPQSEFKQFWGFKRPAYGVEPVSEITDRYGQSIAVRGSINKNPTFDFGGIAKFDIGADIISETALNHLFLTGYGETGDIAKLKELTELPYEFEVNLGDPLIAQLFFCMVRSLNTIHSFRKFMAELIWYVAWWDKVGTDVNVILSGLGFTEVKINGSAAENGFVVKIPQSYDGTGTISFQYDKDAVENTVEFTILLMQKINGEMTSFVIPSDKISAGDGSSVIISDYKIFESAENGSVKLSVPRLYTGMHAIGVRVVEYDTKGKLLYDNGIKIMIHKFDEDNNPYLAVKNCSLYQLARKTLCSFVSKIDKTPSGEGVQVDYWLYFSRMIREREQALYDAIKTYINTYYNIKFYIKINENAEWDVVNEAWDGYSGTEIKHPSVRGKFVNRETGKLPCIYQISNIEGLHPENNTDNSLFAFDDYEKGTGNISFWGKASAEIFVTNPKDADNKVDGLTVLEEYFRTGKLLPPEEPVEEGTMVSYLVATVEARPKVSIVKYGLDANVDILTIGDAYFEKNGVLADDARAKLKPWLSFMEHIRSTDIGAGNFLYEFMMHADVPVLPELFYVPLAHRNIRYGPWILDTRGGRVNRSNFGKTEMVVDEMLNPWTFKDSRKAFQYLLDQHKYDLSSEHVMNRGRIIVADIPRFNIGQKVGSFSNISAINISYGTGGVTTTYTLSAFGAGRIVKEQRERQKIIRKLSRLEDIVADLQNTIRMQRLQTKIKDGAFGGNK